MVWVNLALHIRLDVWCSFTGWKFSVMWGTCKYMSSTIENISELQDKSCTAGAAGFIWILWSCYLIIINPLFFTNSIQTLQLNTKTTYGLTSVTVINLHGKHISKHYYYGFVVPYCNLEKIVKTNVYMVCAFINRPDCKLNTTLGNLLKYVFIQRSEHFIIQRVRKEGKKPSEQQKFCKKTSVCFQHWHNYYYLGTNGCLCDQNVC